MLTSLTAEMSDKAQEFEVISTNYNYISFYQLLRVSWGSTVKLYHSKLMLQYAVMFEANHLPTICVIYTTYLVIL
jgi:hypothetical protein